jgi:putative cell wall-binding protein
VKVGETLTAQIAASAPVGAAATFEWFVGNATTAAATGATYTLVAADFGQAITVKATSTLGNYVDATSSAITAKVAAADLGAGTPAISGTAQVGQTLTATAGTWSPTSVALAYQWKANGAAIDGATHSTYTLTAAVVNTKITVEVTGTLHGYTTVTEASTATTAVAPGDLTKGSVTITGTPKIGVELTAVSGTWAPSGVTLAYQWARNGADIADATSATYTPVAADLGKALSVKVAGSLAGYATATSISLGTSDVAAAQTETTRTEGTDRYATAIAIAQAYAPGVNTVYVANGLSYADALSAGPAAAHLGGPLLLTTATVLPANVKAEIQRLKPTHIVIAGGTGVVTDSVKAELESIGGATVTRVDGLDRYETSRKIAETAFGSAGADTAYIATGNDFPDALSAGPAASHFDGPVILVPGTANTRDAATVKVLKDLKVASVKIAGGTAIVSAGIETQLEGLYPKTVKRNFGTDRYETAVKINQDAFASSDTVYLATGTGFADALAGSALAGWKNAPLYVTPSTCLKQSVLDEIKRLGASDVVLLGGSGVLSDGVKDLAVCK